MPIDGTDIPRSIPAIGRPLQFSIDIVIEELSSPINDVAKATVSYIRSISSDTRFEKDLVTWLTEERRERHRERVNQTRSIIQYTIEDMVMARVQVQSKVATGIVGFFLSNQEDHTK